MTSRTQVVARRARRVLRVRPDDARAMWWAHRALRRVREDLKRDGVRTVAAPPPAGLAGESGRYVSMWLRLRHASCLERCVVLQSWLVAHGNPVPVAIGVGTKDDAFAAHAWLPGFDPPDQGVGFTEITRIEPDRIATH